MPPLQVGGGGPVEVEDGVGVLLKEGGADLGRHGALDGFADDRGLLFTEGEEADATGLENGPAAHGDGVGRDGIQAAEGRRGILSEMNDGAARQLRAELLNQLNR